MQFLTTLLELQVKYKCQFTFERIFSNTVVYLAKSDKTVHKFTFMSFVVTDDNYMTDFLNTLERTEF